METKAQTQTTQAQRDEMTFNLYVDCNLSATETARQMGISRSTVKARVGRHSLRIR
jgi:transcriptional regulator of acetoin/glycerol metabolism